MVNRDQNADEVIHRVRQDIMVAENNLTTMIERIIANNDLNTGLRHSNYTSPIMDFISQTELPRGDLANSENLRIKYFHSSSTKNAFTWFTTLPPNSIDAWPHLERMFHEQFCMGATKISLKELASIKRKFTEPIDDYLNRPRLLKSRCFTAVPEPGWSKWPQDLIQNAIKDVRLKFADKGRSHMKVDVDPLHVADTNYVELVEINMVDMIEAGDDEAKKVKIVSAGKQATESLNDNMTFNTDVEGSSVGRFEPKVTEGLFGKTSEATKSLRVKLEKIRISETPTLGVNMVNLDQPIPEMEELEGCLMMDK
ncbi:uncharacterized protein LOC131634002 [Vicia villosa]|uniref:uncharacterized protein LOC131634002 n=1 Tax=Vicia villosa TaxID=3911 RepID=UPI00273B825A|nr:uncharacterized protein LOC131634002 [Vicia villosa]